MINSLPVPYHFVAIFSLLLLLLLLLLLFWKIQEIHQYNLHLLQQESIRQLYENLLNEKLMNLQENEVVNI